MKRLILLMSLMVILLAGFASAAVVWDSQDHWTAANVSIPGWTETAGKLLFEINSGLQLYSSDTQRNQITRVNDDDYIYFQMDDITIDNRLIYIYWIDATRRFTANFYSNGSMNVFHSTGSIWVNNIFGKEVKFGIDEPNQNFTVFLDDVQQDGILKGLPVAGTAYRHSWDTNAGTGVNISWFCTDDDGTSCSFGGGGGGGTSSINISTPNPTNGNSFNTEYLNINATVNSTYDFNCTLVMDGTVNQSYDGFTAGVNRFVNFSINYSSNAEEDHDYYVRCYDHLGDTNTTNQTYYIDNILPNLGWNFPSNLNNTVVTGNLVSNITIYDPNLYSYEYNVTYPNGTVIYNVTNTSLTGYSNITIAETYNLTGYEGELRGLVRVCDGHTNNNIDFSARTYNKELRFDNDNIKVYPSNKNNYQSLGFERESDRYTFNFNAYNPARTHHFYVESDKFIDILDGKTEYEGHLIIGNKWIDFMTDDLEYVAIERVSKTKVKVEVKLTKDKQQLQFKSIGELNCVTETVQFFAYLTNEEYVSQTLFSTTNQFGLNISYNSSFITSISATFNYNGTQYTPSGAIEGSQYVFTRSITAPIFTQTENVEFFWNYSVNGQSFSTTEKNQTVYIPSIDNCSSNSLVFVNYSLKDELNDTVLTGDIEFIFEYYNGLYSAVYNGSMVASSSFQFCMSPNFSNFTTDVTIQYSVEGYDPRDYVTDNYVVDNTTEQITLFSLIAGQSTDIEIHVIDDSDNDLENVFIEAYRWDIENDVDKLVETEYTDSEGNADFELKTGSEYYSFKFYQNGVLVKSTSRFKLFATEYEFVISDSEATRLSEWLIINPAITRTLVYSNETNEVTFTWSYGGSLVDNFCMQVNTINSTNYYYQCSSNGTGSLSYIITEFNLSYVARGIANTFAGNMFVLETEYIDTSTDWRTFGAEHGLPLSLIIFLVIGLIGLGTGNKDITIGMGVLGMIVVILFGLMPISKLWLVPIVIMGIIVILIMNRVKK